MSHALTGRLWWLTLVLAVAAALALACRPKAQLSQTLAPIQLESSIPDHFGHWERDTRQELNMVNPQLTDALKNIYQQILSRHYINRATGQTVMLSIAYGPDQSYSNDLHVPDICYPAGGFQIISKQDGVLHVAGQPIPVRRLVTQRDKRREPLTYWAMVGEHAVTGAVASKLTALRYGMQGMVPDGMIIRFSSVGMPDEAAFKVQEEFATHLLQALPGAERRRLSGI